MILEFVFIGLIGFIAGTLFMGALFLRDDIDGE